MPNRRVHVVAGLVTGAAAGLATAQRLDSQHRALHVSFAALGGVLGGLLPDALEPATSPNHRGTFHSLLAAAGITSAAGADWAARCHKAAALCDENAQKLPTGGQERSDQELKAILFRALAGLIVGLIAGYASHLALDSTTSRSLPLFTNHF
jgi:membrane-bound metal-dependent hydrolase YbcI (DUF457 family)